jgi:hypothetical protein
MRRPQWRDVPCKPVPTQYERFVKGIRTRVSDPSDFANGARIQAYLDASVRSDREKAPVRIRP